LEKKTLRNNPWVDVPCHKDVWNLLKEQRISDTYYRRGDGQATQDLDWVEATHRNWVKDIIDLSEFQHCYFVNGTTDAIHHWKIIEDRDWQKLCYGEYEYPDMIGPWGQVCCDVEGQYMDEATHRSALPGIIDPNKPLYMSIPSAEDGNYFDPGPIEAPVILDCTYVSSTNIQKINIPPNTEQVFFSFSKGFGLIGQRLGLVYTKKPHPTLQILKEFENWNYGGVRTIDLILSNFKVDEMWNRHREEQIEICNNRGFEPSDCFFLATTRDPYYKRRRRMKWNDNARICITPLFDEYK
jgi:hypothetical protein